MEVPASYIVDSESSYLVLEVVDSWLYVNPKSKFSHHFVQYLVVWEGHGLEENSFKLFEMLEDTTMQALVDFDRRYTSKPRDYRVVINLYRNIKDDFPDLRTDLEKRGLV